MGGRGALSQCRVGLNGLDLIWNEINLWRFVYGFIDAFVSSGGGGLMRYFMYWYVGCVGLYGVGVIFSMN